MPLSLSQFLEGNSLDLNAASGVYLFMCPWPLSAVGGVVQVVKELSLSMEKERRKGGTLFPLVWVPDWSCKKPQFEQHSSGVWVMRMRIPVLHSMCKKSVPWLTKCKSQIYARRRIGLLRAIFDGLRVVCLNVHYVNDMTESLLNWLEVAGRRESIILRLSFHGTDFQHFETMYPMGQHIASHLLRSTSDKVVACSSALRTSLLKFFPPEQILVAYSGVNIRTLKMAARAPLKLPNETPYIIHVGKFTAAKGQIELLHAFAMIHREIPHHLVMVGASTGQFDEVELPKLAAKLGVAHRVSIFCNVPHQQIGGFIAGASVLCLPSHQEAFGLVLMEAGVLGVPVIASDLGGIKECLAMAESEPAANCEMGAIVPVAAPWSLARAMLSALVSDHETTLVKAAKYRDWLHSNRQWENTLMQYDLHSCKRMQQELEWNDSSSLLPDAL